jgi:hypothetical protein
VGRRRRPGSERLVVDVDSFVGEVHGYDKQGAGFGYTHKRGYHPILATRAGTGGVLHIRCRKGSANTARGALRFVEELIPRVRRAGATGPRLLRADSGVWNKKIFARLECAGWTYSIGVRQQKHIKAAIAAIAEQDWQVLADYPEEGPGRFGSPFNSRWISSLNGSCFDADEGRPYTGQRRDRCGRETDPPCGHAFFGTGATPSSVSLRSNATMLLVST